MAVEGGRVIDLYRKKPVVIAATHFDGTATSASRIVAWIEDHGHDAWTEHVECVVLMSRV